MNKFIEFNNNQAPCNTLKTLKGSLIKRSRFGIGKDIGGSLYFHKSYTSRLLPNDVNEIFIDNEAMCPFEYNCVKCNYVNGDIALVECPDFDTAREPVVGQLFIIPRTSELKVTRFYKQIYHHKWLWVTDDYSGFDVTESWEWSRTWLNVLTEPANGSSQEAWLRQLSNFGLS